MIWISPLSGASRPRIILVRVVLPEPDSPTMPKVRPLCSCSETLSTTVRKLPSGPLKALLSCCTCSSGALVSTTGGATAASFGAWGRRKCTAAPALSRYWV
ncbi:hypothetical protein D3C79_757950 [compost metagenome]